MSIQRQAIFISHAYPEDNAFAEWLASRLRVAGYEPWIDLDHLRGGERVWPSVEKAIRTAAFRVLFVTSRVSNEKDGTVKELNLSRGVGRGLQIDDFVIPLIVDDLPYEARNIDLAQLAPISFTPSWAKGLALLLSKLEKVVAPRLGNADSAADFWRRRVSGEDGFRPEPEMLLSNRFKIHDFPKQMRRVSIDHAETRARTVANSELPATSSGDGVFTFTSNTNILKQNVLGGDGVIVNIPSGRPVGTREQDLSNAQQALISAAWEKFLEKRGFKRYALASNRACYYVPLDHEACGRIAFETPWVSSRRALTGSWKGHTWHFALSAKVLRQPDLVLSLTPHVVFSEAGEVWPESGRQHRARRSACRGWWNDRWRDMLLATTSWLAEGKETMSVYPSSVDPISVGRIPLVAESPFSYALDSGSPLAEEFSEADGYDSEIEDFDDLDDHEDP